VAVMYSEGGVTDVELKPNGSLAWIQSRTGTSTVIKLDASGRQELDSAPDVDPLSLALSGSRLYWMRGELPRTAMLD
jgi:hypothetical protein